MPAESAVAKNAEHTWKEARKEQSTRQGNVTKVRAGERQVCDCLSVTLRKIATRAKLATEKGSIPLLQLHVRHLQIVVATALAVESDSNLPDVSVSSGLETLATENNTPHPTTVAQSRFVSPAESGFSHGTLLYPVARWKLHQSKTLAVPCLFLSPLAHDKKDLLIEMHRCQSHRDVPRGRAT